MRTENDSPSDRAASYAMTIATFLNMLGVFASPRVSAKAKEFPSREQVLQHIDDYLAVVDEWSKDSKGGAGLFELNGKPLVPEPHSRKLRALCENWTPSANVPEEIVKTSRAALTALGVPEPREGWDNFEGPPPEPPPEPEDTDPRAPPTEAELAARPDGILVGAATMWCHYLASPKMVAKIASADLRRPALGTSIICSPHFAPSGPKAPNGEPSLSQ